MKVGYSLLLSEPVAAQEIDYGDCPTFQIVCPCCRQPVFKGRRTDTHYLAHYHATTEEAKECDLRTQSYQNTYLHSLTAEGHGQSLAKFLERFQQTVLEANKERLRHITRKDINKILLRPDFDEWAREFIFNLKNHFHSRPLIQEAITGIPALATRSEFWARRQASYIVDVIPYLLSPQGLSSLKFITSLCFILIDRDLEPYHITAAKEKMPFSAEARRTIHAIVQGKSPGEVARLANQVPGKPADDLNTKIFDTREQALAAVKRTGYTLVTLRAIFPLWGAFLTLLASVSYRNPR